MEFRPKFETLAMMSIDNLRKSASNILPILIFAILLLLSLKKYLFLGRFPNQDLFWNDLQLFRSWNWQSELFRSFSIHKVLGTDVDFLINFGDNPYSSSKATAVLFDPGFWAYLITSSLDFAISFRLLVVSGIGALGLYFLLTHTTNGERIVWHSRTNLLFIFAILESAFLFHPQFNYEVGFLNSWIFFLVPTWFAVLVRARSRVTLNTCTMVIWLTALSLSLTDIHILIFLPSIFLLYFGITQSKKGWHLTVVMVLSLTIVFVSKTPFIYSTIDAFDLSHSGTFNETYIRDFIFKLVPTMLTYYFSGPISIFIGLVIPLLTLLIYRTLNTHKRRKFIIGFGSVLVWSLANVCFGVAVHGIYLFAQFMPSLWRYPFGLVPFALISFIAFWSHEVKFQQSLNGLLKSIIVLVLSLQYLLVSVLTPSNFDVVYDKGARDYFISKLPLCIDQKLSRSGIERGTRSILFAAPAFDEVYYKKGRDDSLLILLENPVSLFGRTFNQWRYASNRPYVDFFGYFSWPFLIDDVNVIEEFVDRTRSNVLLTSKMFNKDVERFEYLGRCENTIQNVNLIERNHTLSRDLHIYGVKSEESQQPLLEIDYQSGSLKINGNCELIASSQIEFFEIPIAFRDSLKLFANNEKFDLSVGEDGLVLLSREICDEKQPSIASQGWRLEAFSYRVFLCNIFILVLLLTSFLSCIFRKFVGDKAAKVKGKSVGTGGG